MSNASIKFAALGLVGLGMIIAGNVAPSLRAQQQPQQIPVQVVLVGDVEVKLFQDVLEAASGSQVTRAGGAEMARAVTILRERFIQALATQQARIQQAQQEPAPAPKDAPKDGGKK